MLQQLVLIVIALLYLQKKSVSSLTYEHVAFLLLLAYLMRQSFRVEHLSAADGFTTDIDKEAYTNLHKIVSELYKNDTLTIPGHVHIQGNLQVGDKGDLKVGDAVAGENKGVIYSQWVRATHHQPNKKINDKTININGATDINLTGHVFCHKGVNVTNDVKCRSVHSSGEVHTKMLKTNKIAKLDSELEMHLYNKDGKYPVWKKIRGNGKAMYLA
jgi:hypothetical protein